MKNIKFVYVLFILLIFCQCDEIIYYDDTEIKAAVEENTKEIISNSEHAGEALGNSFQALERYRWLRDSVDVQQKQIDSLKNQLEYYVDECLPDLHLRLERLEFDTGATGLVWNKNPVYPPTWNYNVYFDSVKIASTQDTFLLLTGKRFTVTAENEKESGHSEALRLRSFRIR